MENEHESVEKIKTEKLAEVQELLAKSEAYESVVPAAVTESYLKSAGFESVDPGIVRIISLVAEKFVADITKRASENCKARTLKMQQSSSVDTKPQYKLTMEDLISTQVESGKPLRDAEEDT